MLLLNKNKSKVSSRRQIQIKEVKDGILLLPNNQYRTVIETSSVNLELKSDQEQDILIANFQNFLNSLPSKLQILIRVREIDIDNYLEEIAKTKSFEREKVYKEQIDNYCSFIKNLVSGNKILSRHFYIIVAYQHFDKNKSFPLVREQIRLQSELVIKGLEKLGMRARLLDSLEILDLFYNFYNSQQAKTQELKGQTIEALLKGQYA